VTDRSWTIRLATGQDLEFLAGMVIGSWRGREVGRSLLRALHAAAGEAGIERLSLNVERENFARALYLSEGYRVADASHPQADTMVKIVTAGLPAAGRPPEAA
jgi:GNAT superfamily N-acetyltransferase